MRTMGEGDKNHEKFAEVLYGWSLGLREEPLCAALLGEQELHLAQRAAVLQQLHGKNLALSRNLVIALRK